MSTHNHTRPDRHDQDRRDSDCRDRNADPRDRNADSPPRNVDPRDRDSRDSDRRGRELAAAIDGSTGEAGQVDDSSPVDDSGHAGLSGQTDDGGQTDDSSRSDSDHVDDGGRVDDAELAGDAVRGRRAGRDDGAAKSAAPSYPDARPVGAHLVVDRSEWVPGRNPERHLGYDGQRGYAESYLRCIQCGAERQSERDFPSECDRDS